MGLSFVFLNRWLDLGILTVTEVVSSIVREFCNQFWVVNYEKSSEQNNFANHFPFAATWRQKITWQRRASREKERENIQPRSGLRHCHQASQLRFCAQPLTVSETITANIAFKATKLKKNFTVVRKNIYPNIWQNSSFNLISKRIWTGYNPIFEMRF